MIYLEKKGFPPEMYGRRVGWTNLTQDETNKVFCNVVAATVDEEGAHYGYCVSLKPTLEYHDVPKAHVDGFVAISALSVELSKNANTKASYHSSMDDIDEMTPLLHNGVSPTPIDYTDKKWADSGGGLLSTIKAELEDAGLGSYYPVIYYALNLSIGLDENLQQQQPDTHRLLLPDISMRAQTTQELYDAERTASILANILQIDDETRAKIYSQSESSCKEQAIDYLKSRYQVASQEQEFMYVVSKMLTSNCIFNDASIASSFKLSDLRHWDRTMPTTHCSEAKKLVEDFSQADSIVEQEIKEVSDRLKAIERGAAVLAMLKQAEEGTIVTRFVKQKQFALEV